MKTRKPLSILSFLLIINLLCFAQQPKTAATTPPPNAKVPAKKTAPGAAIKANPNDRFFDLYADGHCTIKNANGKVIDESFEDAFGGGGSAKETTGYPTAIWMEGENPDGSEIGWGFMDEKHKIIIPMIYYEPEGFSEELAAVGLPGGNYGFIDKTGKTIIPFNYDIAHNFSEGMAHVLKNQGKAMEYKSAVCPDRKCCRNQAGINSDQVLDESWQQMLSLNILIVCS
jgi:hypothetical protein